MTFLDLFRPKPAPHYRSVGERKARSISGTEPTQEREMQRGRGRMASGSTPVQRRKDRPIGPRTRGSRKSVSVRPARKSARKSIRKTARKGVRKTASRTARRMR